MSHWDALKHTIFAANMLTFENTEIAFAHKSNRELKKAYWLFRLVGSPGMVKFGKFMVGLAMRLHIPIRWAMKNNIFAQFCGGETIADCAETTKILDLYNIGTILDYSVEGKESEEDFDLTADEIVRTVETAHGNKHIPFCVFKVTGVARFALLEKINSGKKLSEKETAEFERVRKRVHKIAHLAAQTGTPVFVDAEESWIQNTIDQLVHELMEQYNTKQTIVFNTAQMYRHDRLEFLKNAFEEAKKKGYFYGVKLVRGAYMEKERNRAEELGYEDPIQRDKFATDRDFDLSLELCLDNLDFVAVCAGTHNEQSSLLLTKLLEDRNIDPSDKRVYFAQLYGMSDHISFNLSHNGYNVAKYVPYGPIREVIPYLIRRAEENTSVKGQTGRELLLIMRERLRRRTVRIS